MKNFSLKNPLIHFILISLLLVGASPAVARLATEQDTDIAILMDNRHLKIHKDGTYVETTEFVAEVRKESGKDKLVTFPLVYNTRNSKIKIIEAKTIRGNQEFPVDLKNIEDKPLASSPQGFDQNNQILIAFPELALDAKVYVKYEITEIHAPIPGYFSMDFIYGMSQYSKDSQVHMVSELPLHVEISDSEQFLEVKQGQDNQKYTLDIVLKKPIIKMPVDEQFVALDAKLYPWVTVSSLKEWPKLGELLSKRYEEVLNRPLPESFEKIAKEAETKATLIEKINTVTARLAESITYMGDWRTVEGAYIPRNLAEIAKSRLGDCKDFSASTVAILRRIGIQADPALIHRGVDYLAPPNHLPNMFNFNHAFVRVYDGKENLWVDPTNFTSFAQGIYPDIAKREALVLDPKNPQLMMTSTPEAKDSIVTLMKKNHASSTRS